MGADARRGVVNADCRVHTVTNLYVTGSSVFPTAGCDMPTYTIVALAIRLADHIRTRLESHSTGV
jgi:choline dehydrogenase-like flavoprotein